MSNFAPRDKRQHFDEVLFSTRLKPTDKLVSVGLMYFVNAKAGCTYVHPLTVAKRIGVKFDKVRAALDSLKAEGHWTVREKDGRIYYIPRLRGDCVIKSVRGDKEYYRWRGAMIDGVAATRGLTPTERIAVLGILSQTWRDYSRNESSRDIAKLVCVSQPVVARVMAVMAGRKQVENELKTSKATYAQFAATSEANSGNSGNTLSVRTDRHAASSVSRSEDNTKVRKAEKRSGEEERESPSLVPSPDCRAEIYREVRERFGEEGAAVIGKAEREGWTAEQIRKEMESVAEDGGDVRELAYALWLP